MSEERTLRPLDPVSYSLPNVEAASAPTGLGHAKPISIPQRLKVELKLQNNYECFKNLRGNIVNIMRRYLDTTLTVSNQSESLRRVEEELKETYPEIFGEGASKRLHSALRAYISDCHGKYRYSIKSKNRHGDKENIGPSQSVPAMSRRSSSDLSQRSQTSAISYPSPSLIPYVLIPSSLRFASTGKAISSRPSQRRIQTTQADTPSTITGTPSHSNWQLASGQANSSSHPHSASDSVVPRSGHQIGRIHAFLGECIPPMTHFLQRFIDFGCVNEEYLFGISLWSPEQIHDFLCMLPPGPGGKPMTDMEMFILQHHITHYFT